MKIGIFGGTFNPIHNGHISVVRKVKEELNLDFVFLVPTSKTPDKAFSVEKNTPIDRYNMIKESITKEDEKWLKVSNFEIKSKDISYSYKTVKFFKKNHPNAEIFLIMGEDRYRTFDTWKNVTSIRNDAKIVVFRRSSMISERLRESNDIFIDDQFFPISSSSILKNLEWNNLPEGAKKYIAKNNLYLKTITFKVLAAKRYEHSVAVASHAVRLSRANKYKKIDKAYNAGIVHDLFKLHSDEFLIEYFNKYNEGKELPPLKALHGFVAADWLENEYGMTDKEITNAIRRHTLAHPEMNKLDKILYVADKVSSDRKGDKIGKLRKLAYSNLELTYIKILKYSIKSLREKGIEPHKDTILALEKYNKDEYKLKKLN